MQSRWWFVSFPSWARKFRITWDCFNNCNSNNKSMNGLLATEQNKNTCYTWILYSLIRLSTGRPLPDEGLFYVMSLPIAVLDHFDTMTTMITWSPWSLSLDHHDHHPTTWKNIKWNIFRRLSSWKPKIWVKTRLSHSRTGPGTYEQAFAKFQQHIYFNFAWVLPWVPFLFGKCYFRIQCTPTDGQTFSKVEHF